MMPALRFDVPLEKCDVLDTARLAEFRSKLAQWHDEMFGDDPSCVWRQIHTMMWNDTLFRTLNDLRAEAASTGTSAATEFSGTTFRLLAAGFVELQANAIRRVTEPRASKKSDRVVSLRTVAMELVAGRELMTREVYVGWNGAPYDSAAAFDRWRAALPSAPGGVVACALPSFGDSGFHQSELAHATFDSLCWGAAPRQARQRGDVVSSACLELLLAELDRCKDIRKFANKFIAHASHPETRVGLSPDQQRVTLDGLGVCSRAVIRVASFVSERILGIATVSVVPTPQYGHLDHLDKGWVPAAGMEHALDRWQANVGVLDQMAADPILPPVGAGEVAR